MTVLATTGMTPTAFFSEVAFVGSHGAVIREVYTGTAVVGSTFEDARFLVEDDFPDVNTVVTVLTYTQPIPNEPWVFRSGLEATTAQSLADGIVAVAGTPQGQSALQKILGFVPDGIGKTDDSAYDFYRAMASEFGWEVTCRQIFIPFIRVIP